MKFTTLALLATVAYAQDDEAAADDTAADDTAAADPCADCTVEQTCSIKKEGGGTGDVVEGDPYCGDPAECYSEGADGNGNWWLIDCPDHAGEEEEGASKLIAATSAALMLAYAM